MLRGALAALAAAMTLALAPAAAQAPGRPGEFDFYVLSLSWSPTYCASEAGKRSEMQCRAERPYAFVVHGLWPQYERGYPQDCDRNAPRIPERTLNEMLDIMPSRGLVIHEWRKHGTCSGLSPVEYFSKAREARARVKIPAPFERLDRYLTTTPGEIEAAFIAANPGLSSGMIAVDCDRRNLREVRVCLSKDLQFRQCAEVDRKACTIDKVVMPPTRGGN